MDFDLPKTIALLERTPTVLDALLCDLPEDWTHRGEGDSSWTPFGIVGHLIYADKVDWMPRAHRILESGEARPFDPFDRLGHVQEIEGKSMPRLLSEFAQVRAEVLDDLRGLDLGPADLERKGAHAALGTVTMSELLATWAAHDLTHLHQISRVMAYQYREAVGPFVEFLGVLQCNGHGS